MGAGGADVIVRCLVGDDPEQARRARGVIGQEAVFVPRTVVLEVEALRAMLVDDGAS